MKGILAGSVAIALFSVHILCTVLYNIPDNPVTKYYKQPVTRYMEPYFTQKWLLFAPEPATSTIKLWYRVYVNGKWLHWQDPIAPVLKRHQHLRVTYNAKLLYVYGNIPKDLSFRYVLLQNILSCKEDNSNCIKKLEDSLLQSSEYKLAVRFAATDYLHNTVQPVKPDSLQLMIIRLYPKQYSERLSNKPFGLAETKEFKPVSFPRYE